MTKHCCEQMKFQLEEGRTAILYYPQYRSYSIYVIDWAFPKEEIDSMKDIIAAYQDINYCPWCGRKLPEDLVDKWYKILECEYNLEEPLENKDKIPKEFRSDEWWKKRGL